MIRGALAVGLVVAGACAGRPAPVTHPGAPPHTHGGHATARPGDAAPTTSRGGRDGDDGDEARDDRGDTALDATTLDDAPPPSAPALEVERGWATWYGRNWHGRATASGERFDMHQLTAAHRTLPLGSIVRVTNTRNGRAVEVRINDRGPYGRRRERIIDVSRAAARRLDFIDAGSCPVTIEVLRRPPPRRGQP
jgi:rare lipoprotein A